jgi:S-adenosylmethionine/arginine decarboxylase-like enzyme
MNASAGRHVVVDGFVRDAGVFVSGTLTVLFHEVVKALDMTILKGPDFVEVPVDPEVLERVKRTGIFEDEGGITGTCIISTSHISIHCWPLQQFFSMDVFSCKDFDHEKALAVIRLLLGVTEANVHVLNRLRPMRSEPVYIPFTSPMGVIPGLPDFTSSVARSI